MTEALIGEILTGETLMVLDETVDVEVEIGCVEIVVDLIGFIVTPETVFEVLILETVVVETVGFVIVVAVVVIGVTETTVLATGCET